MNHFDKKNCFHRRSTVPIKKGGEAIVENSDKKVITC